MPVAAAVALIAAPAAVKAIGTYAISTLFAGSVVVSAGMATAVGTGIIAGGVTALRGGSASDVLKSAVLSGVAAGVGSYAGNIVGSEVASATGSKIAAQIASNVAKSTVSAAVLGRDVGKAAFIGLASGVPLALSQFESFNQLPDFAKNAIAAGTAAAITGGDVKTATLSSALQSANIMGTLINSNETVKSFLSDPSNKEVSTLIQNGLSYGISAAVQGRDIGEALQQSLVRSAGQLLGSTVAKGLKEATAAAQARYAEAQTSENTLRDNIVQQQSVVDKYNAINSELQAKVDHREKLVKSFESKRNQWQEMADAGDVGAANAFVGTVNEAAQAVNDYTNELNSFYESKKSTLEEYKAQLDALQTDFDQFAADYDTKSAVATDAAKQLEAQNAEFQKHAEEEVAKAVDPFETTPEEARAIFAKYRGVEAPEDLLQTTMWKPEEQIDRAAAQFQLAKTATDPEYYNNLDTAYKYAMSQGRSADEAEQFAIEFANYKTGRSAFTPSDQPEFTLDVPDAYYAGTEGLEAPAGTQLASREEVENAFRMDDDSVRYRADINAYVKALTPEIAPDLAGAASVTTDQLADYQSMDGNYRVPNPDGSYHVFSKYGVYQGLYSGNDQFVGFNPDDAPFKVVGDISDYPIQNFGTGTEEFLPEYDKALQDIFAQRGGFPVGWQTVGSDRVFVYDDGTAVGLNTDTDQSYALSPEEVSSMIDNGLLNTAASGYDFTSPESKFSRVPGSGNRAPVRMPSAQQPPGSGGFRSPNQVSPAPRDATIAATPTTAQQTATGSTLGAIPGSWVGGLGREVKFIDPLETAQAGSPEVEEMVPSSPLRSVSEQQSQLQSNYWNPQQQQVNYYSYGVEPTYASVVNSMGSAGMQPRGYKAGGNVMASPLMAASGGDVQHKGSHYVQGAGGGQDDLISAKLADGEYVLDAEIVAALGDGSNRRGAEILDKWREEIRKHKRSASIKGIPPKAKSPLAYMKGIKQNG